MKVYDGFMFFNEFHILECRLQELWPVVDRFILVEAGETFSGQKKPLHFTELKHVFKRYMDKITVVTLSGFPLGMESPWEREAYQRNAILRGLPKDYSDDDLLMVSDCDEIPFASEVKHARDDFVWKPPGVRMHHLSTVTGQRVAFRQRLYFYNPCWRHVKPWFGTRMAQVRHFTELGSTPQSFRFTMGALPGDIVLMDGGVSYSYFGGVEAVQQKVAAYSHTEVNRPEYTSDEHVAESIANGLPLVRGDGNEFVFDPDLSTHPKFVQEHPDLFGLEITPHAKPTATPPVAGGEAEEHPGPAGEAD